MPQILTSTTALLEHYLSYKNSAADFPRLGTLTVTGATAATATDVLGGVAAGALMGANKLVCAAVSSISDIASAMTLILTNSASAKNTCVGYVPVTAGGSGYASDAAVTATGGTGSGFAGTAVVDAAGAITSVIITNPGNYTVAPTSFSCSGGTGATFGAAVMGFGVARVSAHAGIDVCFPFLGSGGTNAITAMVSSETLTIVVKDGSANVKIELISIDESTSNPWLNMGENFNEGLTFNDGVMTAPVARGYNATDHSKRIRVNNSWSIRQMYCSANEGIANLRGKTIMIKDRILTDGVTLKETRYVVGCQVYNAAPEVGGGGGEAQVDSISAGGSYTRSYRIVWNSTSLTA